MHLSMSSSRRRGGRGGEETPGIAGGFDLASFFLFKCPTPGMLSWFAKEYKFPTNGKSNVPTHKPQ